MARPSSSTTSFVALWLLMLAMLAVGQARAQLLPPPAQYWFGVEYRGGPGMSEGQSPLQTITGPVVSSQTIPYSGSSIFSSGAQTTWQMHVTHGTVSPFVDSQVSANGGGADLYLQRPLLPHDSCADRCGARLHSFEPNTDEDGCFSSFLWQRDRRCLA